MTTNGSEKSFRFLSVKLIQSFKSFPFPRNGHIASKREYNHATIANTIAH
jgi:hypothetical protein